MRTPELATLVNLFPSFADTSWYCGDHKTAATFSIANCNTVAEPLIRNLFRVSYHVRQKANANAVECVALNCEGSRAQTSLTRVEPQNRTHSKAAATGGPHSS